MYDFVRFRTATPNPASSRPPAPQPLPPAGSFDPLSATERAKRREHGMSRDSGPMLGELEETIFPPPSGGGGGTCVPIPANFEETVARAISSELQNEISLNPTDAPDPMRIARIASDEAMPIIITHYSPHAPNVSSASFMRRVSRKRRSYGNPLRYSSTVLGEFWSGTVAIPQAYDK